MAQISNHKSLKALQWASKTTPAKQNELTLDSRPWVVYADTVMKYYFVPGVFLKGKVEEMGQISRS